MSLGTAIAELQRRFDRLAQTKGGNPGTYGTKGRGKGQQPKRKNNPAHVAGAIAAAPPDAAERPAALKLG